MGQVNGHSIELKCELSIALTAQGERFYFMIIIMLDISQILNYIRILECREAQFVNIYFEKRKRIQQ